MAKRRGLKFLTEDTAANNAMAVELMTNGDAPVLADFFEQSSEFADSDLATYKRKRLEFEARLEGFVTQLLATPNFSKRSAPPVDETSDGRKYSTKFSAMSPCVDKRVQKTFVDPLFRQVFQDASCEGVKESIIDVKRITKHLLHVLGLDHLHDPRSIRKYTRLMGLLEAGAIDEIKKFFAENVEPLDEDCRLLHLTEGKNKGRILIPRNLDEDRATFELTQLYKVPRKSRNIEVNYQANDIVILRRIAAMIQEVTKQVLEGWTPEMAEELEAKVEKAIEGLSREVKEDCRVIIMTRVSACTSFEDSCGRLNPYSRLALLNSTTKFIRKRLNAVTGMRKRVSELDPDHALNLMIDDLGLVSLWVDQKMEKRGRRPGVDVSLLPEERDKALMSLDKSIELIDSCHFEPFVSASKMVLKPLQELRELVATSDDYERDFTAMREKFARAFAVAKLMNAEYMVLQTRELLITAIMNSSREEANSVRKQISKTLQMLNNRAIADDVYFPDLSPVYSIAYSQLAVMNKIAKQACSPKNSAPARRHLFKQIDDIAMYFSVVEMMEDYNEASS